MTAYHEVTKQRRFNINLGKLGTKLIDENSNHKQVGEKNRRKSAFAQDEDGYMFLPEGFRLRFGNGETIDFYADTVSQKDEWVKMISEAVGKDAAAEKMSWTGLVLAKERADAAKKEAPLPSAHQAKPNVPPRQTTKSLPNSPQKGMRPKSTVAERAPPPPVEKSPTRQNPFVSPQKRRENAQTAKDNKNTGSDRSDRRRGVRSMIF